MHPLGVGGNKLRKLEFLLGAAIENGADTVITFGALQTNHGRQTAAACAKLGLRCELVLTAKVPAKVTRTNGPATSPSITSSGRTCTSAATARRPAGPTSG